jgi:hypothetical protein
MNQYCGFQQALGWNRGYTLEQSLLQPYLGLPNLQESYRNVGMGNVSVTRDIDIRLLEVRKKMKDVRWKMQQVVR